MEEPPESIGREFLAMASAALQIYQANPVLRSLVLAIPVVGAPLDLYAGTAGGELAMERVRVLLDELRERLDRFEESQRDRAVREEDLIDATIRAVRAALETGSLQKVRLLASALVGATARDRPRGLDVESIMAAIAYLTPADIAHAAEMAEPLLENQGMPIEYSAAVSADVDAIFFLHRLQGAGLVNVISVGGGLGGGGGLQYRFSPTFWRMRELLVAGGDEFGSRSPEM